MASAKPLSLSALVGVYLDHGLRPSEVPEEVAFVRALVERGGGVFVYASLDLAKEGASLQWRARALRRAKMESLAEQMQCTKIAVGHHRDDQVETFFLRLFRGTGPRGLAGMWPRRGSWIRPLLPFSRMEIEALHREQRWGWCEDSSNQTSVYRRNALRHEVIPYLERVAAPQLRVQVSTLCTLKQEDERYFQREVEMLSKHHAVQMTDSWVRVQRDWWIALPKSLGVRLLQHLLERLLGSRWVLQHLEQTWNKAIQGDCGALSLPKPWRCQLTRQHLWLLHTNSFPQLTEAGVRLEEGQQQTVWGHWSVQRFLVPEQVDRWRRQREAVHGATPIVHQTFNASALRALHVPKQGEVARKHFGAPFWTALFSDAWGVLEVKRRTGGERLWGHRRTLKKWLSQKKIPSFLGVLLPLVCRDGQ
ncbi:MAG: tRNA lysidine(34) synthetase TilS, partial [Myxococcota bacterium]